MKHEIIHRYGSYFYEGTRCIVITQMPDNLQHLGTFNDSPNGVFHIYTAIDHPKMVFIKGKTLTGEVILSCVL